MPSFIKVPSKHQSIPPLIADFCLLLVALVWGASFIVVKNLIVDLPPLPYLAIRFLIAFGVLLPFLWPQRTHINRSALSKSAVIGTCLFLGYTTQTVGLQYTTASNAAFITGLNVVIVPLLVAGYAKHWPRWPILGGALISAAGLGLLCLGDSFRASSGDLIVLFCAFCFACHIFLIGRFAPDVNATVLAAFQILTVALLCALGSGLEILFTPASRAISFTPYVGWGILLTAVFCTSIAFLVQSKMQQFTSASHTAIIFASEPVFGALFAYLLAGELLSQNGLIGAALVLTGILLAELGSIRRSKSGIPV